MPSLAAAVRNLLLVQEEGQIRTSTCMSPRMVWSLFKVLSSGDWPLSASENICFHFSFCSPTPNNLAHFCPACTSLSSSAPRTHPHLADIPWWVHGHRLCLLLFSSLFDLPPSTQSTALFGRSEGALCWGPCLAPSQVLPLGMAWCVLGGHHQRPPWSEREGAFHSVFIPLTRHP